MIKNLFYTVDEAIKLSGLSRRKFNKLLDLGYLSYTNLLVDGETMKGITQDDLDKFTKFHNEDKLREAILKSWHNKRNAKVIEQESIDEFYRQMKAAYEKIERIEAILNMD